MVRHADWPVSVRPRPRSRRRASRRHRSRVRRRCSSQRREEQSSSVLALTGSMTTLSGSYSTTTCSKASSAISRDSATMAAIGSPRIAPFLTRASEGSLLHWSAHDGREFGTQVIVGVDGENAGHRLRVRRVNRHDPGVRHARSHERHVDRTRKCEIGDVGPSTVRNLGSSRRSTRCQEYSWTRPFFGRVRPRHVPML